MKRRFALLAIAWALQFGMVANAGVDCGGPTVPCEGNSSASYSALAILIFSALGIEIVNLNISGFQTTETKTEGGTTTTKSDAKGSFKLKLIPLIPLPPVTVEVEKHESKTEVKRPASLTDGVPHKNDVTKLDIENFGPDNKYSLRLKEPGTGETTVTGNQQESLLILLFEATDDGENWYEADEKVQMALGVPEPGSVFLSTMAALLAIPAIWRSRKSIIENRKNNRAIFFSKTDKFI